MSNNVATTSVEVLVEELDMLVDEGMADPAYIVEVMTPSLRDQLREALEVFEGTDCGESELNFDED